MAIQWHLEISLEGIILIVSRFLCVNLKTCPQYDRLIGVYRKGESI